MAWLSTILGRITRTLTLTLTLTPNGRGSSLRSLSSSHTGPGPVPVPVDTISSPPLAFSLRSPSSSVNDELVSALNRIVNDYKLISSSRRRSMLISSGEVLNHFRAISDFINQNPIPNMSSGQIDDCLILLTKALKMNSSSTPSGSLFGSDELIISSLDWLINNYKTISSAERKHMLISSDKVVNHLTNISDIIKQNPNMSSDRIVDCLVLLANILKNKTIVSRDQFDNVEFIPDETLSPVDTSHLRTADDMLISSDEVFNYLKTVAIIIEINPIMPSNMIVDCLILLANALKNKTIVSRDPFTYVELIPDDTFDPVETVRSGYYYHVYNPDPYGDLDNGIQETMEFLKLILDCNSQEYTGVIYKAFAIISSHSIFETCSIDDKLKVLATVYDQIRNQPQANPLEVYFMNIFLRSMSNDDNRKYINKDEVISRVIDVVQSYPEVGHHKVTGESDLDKDLGLNSYHRTRVHKALYLEFRIKVPFEASCKEICDYIYNNHIKRPDFETFRERNINGHIFWPRSLFAT